MWQHSVIGDYLAKYRVSIIDNARRFYMSRQFTHQPAAGHVTRCAERPQESPGGDGGSMEVNGEEREDSLDQEGGGGPEALRGVVSSCGPRPSD